MRGALLTSEAALDLGLHPYTAPNGASSVALRRAGSAGYGPTLTLVALALCNAHALAGTSLPLPLVAAQP